MANKRVSSKKKVVKVEPVGQAHITFFISTILLLTLTNSTGEVISWSSARENGL
jgi:small subunit ribosomal protein S11